MKTDYYELLGVSSDSTPADIKKGYFKQSLVWHPDKNPHRLEEADRVFKEILNAYTTLMDPMERRWYDDHKDAILRGYRDGCAAESGYSGPDHLNVWDLFGASAFDGFGDGPRNFFTVYGNAFARLAKEEGNPKATAKLEAAPFGDANSPVEVVRAFYATWGGFSSAKTFSWVDIIDLRQTNNRRERRFCEGKNEEARKKAKREFSEAVRQLVQRVRKRDPRVNHFAQVSAAAMAAASAERKARLDAEKARKAAARAATSEAANPWEEIDANRDVEAEEALDMFLQQKKGKKGGKGKGAARAAAADSDADADAEVVAPPSPSKDRGDAGVVSDDNDGEVLVAISCYLCRKRFVTIAKLKDHCRSKKHKDAAASAGVDPQSVVTEAIATADPTRAEEAAAADAAASVTEKEGGGTVSGAGSSDVISDAALMAKLVALSDAATANLVEEEAVEDPSGSGHSSQEEEEEDQEEEEEEEVEEQGDGEGYEKLGGGAAHAAGTTSSSSSASSESEVEPIVFSSPMSRKPQKARRGRGGRGPFSARGQAYRDAGSSESDDVDLEAMAALLAGPRGKRSNPLQGVLASQPSTGKGRRAKAQDNAATHVEAPSPFPAQATVSKGKKKGKGPANSRAQAEEDSAVCKVCDAEFESRSALFRHIKQTGHAVLKVA